MVEIEYNSTKINVPESWDDITLGVYERFHKIKPTTHRERVAQIAQVCSLDVEQLFNWPTEVFNHVVRIAGFIFENDLTPPSPFIEVDGVKYFVPLEDALTLGAYVDADDVQKNSDAVLSNLLAIICRPAGEAYDYANNETRAAMFAALPVSRVLGVLAFFLQYRQALDKRIEAFSNLAQVADQLPPNINSLRALTGGIKLFQIWPIIRYLISIWLLQNQLRKFSRSYSTKSIKTSRKRRKES